MSKKVTVRGAKELKAAFRELDAETKKGLGREISKAAQPVRDEARNLLQKYQGISLKTIRVKRSGPVVSIQQGATKTTGKRPDFGALQMTHGLVPAVEDKSSEVVEAVGSAIDRWITQVGLGP
jgi:hypothetical protein